MKKNLFLTVFGLMSFVFSASAHNYCSSITKEKTSFSKKAESIEKGAANSNEKAVIVFQNSVVDTTEKFTVYGNCGMCKRTIDGSLTDVAGVTLADWDKETDQMTVSFNPEVITLDDIKQKIADVGYDSDTHRAKDTTYSALPGCCQYDRPEN